MINNQSLEIKSRLDGWRLKVLQIKQFNPLVILFELNKKLLHCRVEAALRKAHVDIEEVNLKQRPTRSKGRGKLSDVRRGFFDLLVSHRLYAALRHHPERCHSVVRL